MSERSFFWLASWVVLLGSLGTSVQSEEAGVVAGNDAVKKIMETYGGRGTLADDTPPTPAEEAVKQFQLRPDLAIDLMGSEPVVEQPLYGSWDSKGRFWLTQYRQYQFPAGLKIVSYDSHLRAKFDKVPLPPPRGEKGADKITVFEDTDGDGFFDKHTDVITGLNIASAALHGMGRIWVLNPPYLLSYPDADNDALPDGDPEVELSGFGIQDTHSVATSLQWGMDGWLYGANGSTTTGNVSSANSKNVKWEGQCIWRYHPREKTFEVYAEGGGNTFSLDIDSKGRVFSGTNNGKTRGMHYEQGSYGMKNWGKHGPLTNPYAFGWFEHMEHEGDARRFPQAFTIYEGGLLGSAYEGKIIAPNSLANLVYVSEVIPDGSTFRTKDETELLTSPDRWFRPVWTGVGPDGGIYIADWYDTRLSHVRPVDDWHKTSGRIYRVRPAAGAPRLAPFDLTQEAEGLVEHLRSPNEWFRKQAALEIAWRGLAKLKHVLLPWARENGPYALDALWTLDMLGEVDAALLAEMLTHPDPHVRRWAVKIAGERAGGMGSLRGFATSRAREPLANLAVTEQHPEVRAQLLASAKRLPAAVGLPLLWAADDTRRRVRRNADLTTNGTSDGRTLATAPTDERLALLAWWALEAKAEKEREEVFVFLREDTDFLHTGLFANHLAGNLAKRYALAGGEANFQSCADLLALAPNDEVRGKMIAGIASAFEGGEMLTLPDALSVALKDYLSKQSGGDLTLALRSGDVDATKQALKVIADSKVPNAQRIAVARTLAELGNAEAVAPILTVLANGSASSGLKRAMLQSASLFEDRRIAEAILKSYERNIAGDIPLREDAFRVLAGRLDWARELVHFVNEWKVPADHVPADVVRQLSLHGDAEVDAGIQKHWKRLLIAAPTEEKAKEGERIKTVLQSGLGDSDKGKLQFVARCAICHQLFGEGGNIGPDLTGYERTSVDFWLDNLFNPSLEIREGFGAYIVKTKGGQILTGIMDAQDAKGIVLKDMAGNRTPVREADIETLEASPISLMPEGLLTGLSDADLRDFFAYLMQPAN